MSDIDLKLLPEFVVETMEHLDELDDLLMQLVDNPQDLDVLNEVFRPVHTIKGSAQFIGFAKIARLSHRLEDLLDILREGRKECTPDIISLLLSTRDRIVKLVSELDTSKKEESEIDDLIDQLSVFISDDVAVPDLAEQLAKEVFSDESKKSVIDKEDSDTELLKIFVNHQCSQLDKLTKINRVLSEQDNKSTVLSESLGVLQSLKASANYMDYRELVNLYANWIGEVEAAKESVDTGSQPDMQFMDVYFTDMESYLTSNDLICKKLRPEADQDGFDMPDLDELQAAVNAPEEEAADSLLAGLEDLGENEVDSLLAGLEGEEDSSDSLLAGLEAEAKTEDSLLAGLQGEVEEDNSLLAGLDAAEEESHADLALLPDFVVETTEHLEELETLLLQLTNNTEDLDVLNEIFRPVHTIKGSAQFIGIARVAKLSHRLEDLLDLLRQGYKVCTPEIVNVLMSARDRMRQLVSELDTSQAEQSSIEDLIEKISFYINKDAIENEQSSTVEDVPQELAMASASYDEEYDKELFEIFIKHLHKQLQTLKLKQDDINEAFDKRPLIKECLAILMNIKSSANYMSYEKLIIACDLALTELQLAETQSAQNETVTVTCLDVFYLSVYELYPGLRLLGMEETGSVALSTDTTGDKQIESSTVLEEAQLSSNVDEDGLYDSLSHALSDAKHKVSKVEYDTLHNVFDELIAKPEDKPKETKEDAKAEKKSVLKRRSVPERKTDREAKESKVKRSLRVDSGKIDSLMNQVGELVVDRSYFQQLFMELGELQQVLKENPDIDQKEIKAIRTFSYRFGEAISGLARTSNELQEEVMKMRMLPISQIFNRYPRLIHDLTHGTDKKVNLIVRGEETELDKMIVEEISDPLIHIIRNAVDHGLESMSQRLESGKHEEGSLILEAYQESNNIVIEVTDDGKGIDQEKIKKKALEKGLYSADELSRMNARDINQLILSAGFSTADKITGTSGRGVGMDVVKQNIDKLNGVLEIESKLGFGTRMRLKIPLTLAIIHALMVRVGQELFTVPLANVDETVRIKDTDISTVEGVEVIYLRGQTLPIFRLSTMFSVECEENNENLSVVIVNRNGQRTGFVVDELMGQDEVVIKPLTEYVQHKSGFSGATIIGDGRISLILDVFELVRMNEMKQIRKQKRQAQVLKSKVSNKKFNDEKKQLLD